MMSADWMQLVLTLSQEVALARVEGPNQATVAVLEARLRFAKAKYTDPFNIKKGDGQ